MFDAALGFIKIVFTRFHTVTDHSPRFSFSDFYQIFSYHFSFSRLRSQMS